MRITLSHNENHKIDERTGWKTDWMLYLNVRCIDKASMIEDHIEECSS
uniref:Uncharacterized protein n=1 Tax=Octopus bimaculoides TaxID=37653 RepID=A0A0L8H5E1_OCTBM